LQTQAILSLDLGVTEVSKIDSTWGTQKRLQVHFKSIRYHGNKFGLCTFIWRL